MSYGVSRKLMLIEDAIHQLPLQGKPENLYEPMRYMLALGGKRIRPVLALLGNELFGGNAEDALPAAMAVELFHNFSLIHDDLMDHSPMRRGQATVHEKWNSTIAILSGDLMLVKAFEPLHRLPSSIQKDCRYWFEKTAIEVCEGQQLDMNFEHEKSITTNDYIAMITLKTAVLLGCSLYLGARTGGASVHDAEQLAEAGKELGIAFQLRDDYLDAFGGEEFGKRIGNDILANKKTFLLISALELADQTDLNRLQHWINHPNPDEEQKIAEVLAIFKKYQVDKRSDERAMQHYHQAMDSMKSLQLNAEAEKELMEIAATLLHRKV